MAETITKVRQSTTVTTTKPGKFKVVFYNDDTTPMDFVIAVLMKVFRHNEDNAVMLTMKVHNDGSAIAGVYTYEVAEQKGMEATNLARQNSYALVIKVEAE
jgi:ATP-dependent Clp protease adaptor protein ClpS